MKTIPSGILTPVLCLLTGILLSGCGRSDRLVVYADPWMEPFPSRVTEAFAAAYPGIEVELQILSSEVIAQHLHFGRPMDVILGFNAQVFRERGLEGRLGRQLPIAPVDLVLVETPPEMRRTQLGASHCRAIEASGRPLRLLGGDRMAFPGDSCTLVADFCRQMQDYLLRGWVAGGWVPGFFARKHPDRMRIVEQGPSHPEAFAAMRLEEPVNAVLADLFMEFLAGEKSKTLLAEENIIP